MRPPFVYFGAKQTIAKKIVQYFPEHIHYVEPYCGSMAVLLEKPVSRAETMNDLDQDVVNFWRVLREHPKELEERCMLTPHSRAEQQNARSIKDCQDPIERARLFWVLVTQGRSGRYYHQSGWRHYKNAAGRPSGFSNTAKMLRGYVDRFGPVLDRIKNISLECRPAQEVIQEYGRFDRTLLYLDPPYLLSTRNGRLAYKHEMRDQDHKDMLDLILACKSNVVLSGYCNPLYNDALKQWERVEIQAYSGNADTNRSIRTEVLWANFELKDRGGDYANCHT